MSTETKSFRVNTVEEGDDEMGNIRIEKQSKSNRKCLVISGCVIILILALITTILSLVFCQNENSTNTTNEQAVDILEHLENVDNFTDSDLNSFDKAFNTFDYNGDGFLNETEFGEYISIQSSHSVTYGVIDADNDMILSYPEVVAYLTEMIKNEYLFNTYFKNNVIPAVKSYYDYNYSDSDPLFIEYAAMALYFNAFDIDSNGYIRYDEYLLIVLEMDFNFADSDSNGKLSKDEFFNVLYGNDDNSFPGIIKSLSVDDVNELSEAINSITLNMEQTSSVQINLCPIRYSQDPVQRRRLRRRRYNNRCLVEICTESRDGDPKKTICIIIDLCA